MKIILLFIVLISVTGCATSGNRYIYGFNLKEEKDTVLRSENINGNLVFQDEKIDAVFSLTSEEIDFIIKNKTSQSIKILWDNAMISQFGIAGKIMHKGVKYIDRNGPQLPTVIPPNFSISDLAVPTENIYYREGHVGEFTGNYYAGGWETKDMFPDHDYNDETLKKGILAMRGYTVRLFLPMEIEGKEKSYNFSFTVASVHQAKDR